MILHLLVQKMKEDNIEKVRKVEKIREIGQIDKIKDGEKIDESIKKIRKTR